VPALPALPALSSEGAFGGDDGSADPFLAAVLADHAAGQADMYAVQNALLTARVLVPVVATATQTERTRGGSTVESVAQMATVTVTGRDGRLALPVFTSTAALVGWDPAARPFPTHAPSAAAGAYAAGAVALLVDFAGPHHVVVEGPPMLALAEGRPWVPAAQDPEVCGAVHAALAGLPGLAGVDIGTSSEADLCLTLHVDPLAADRVRAVAQEAAARLARVDLLRTRLDRGLDLAAVSL
jgi:hypothetical protein